MNKDQYNELLAILHSIASCNVSIAQSLGVIANIASEVHLEPTSSNQDPHD